MNHSNSHSVKYIFITGGVVSSLGKGISAAAIGALLKARGYNIRIKKLDPYLNVDPGTMNPFQHGEVFVTDDGTETDLDLGHYERFTNTISTKDDNVTAGRIYMQLIARERKGEYLGATVQTIPHVTNLIKEFICEKEDSNIDFVICEIGGTVGDIEGLPFLESIRQIQHEKAENSILIHLTLLPYIATVDEIKTKPTQHSVRELQSLGIKANMLLCRSSMDISIEDQNKLALFCNVAKDAIFIARDVKEVYSLPLHYHKSGIDAYILKLFDIDTTSQSINLKKWELVNSKLEFAPNEVNIAIVGKYIELKDSYLSIIEALKHAGIHLSCKVNIHWIHSAEEKNLESKFENIHGILVPGGFGERGIEGKIESITFARKYNIPFFGICLGMQLAVIEFARNVISLEDVHSREFTSGKNTIVGIIDENITDIGATMRLGAYRCNFIDNTLISKLYNASFAIERHRHRYEVNSKYQDQFEEHGMIFSGISNSGLPESIEIPNHPFFIGVQYHPEFKSRPFAPHPIFQGFIQAATDFCVK